MAEKAPSEPEHVQPHGLLIDKLNEFRDFCGGPSLGDIERISKQLAMHYGDRYGVVKALPQATVSSVLAGKRKKPPKRPWLVAFVLTCEWFAWKEAGVQTEWATGDRRTGRPDPERVLAGWIRGHEAVLAASRSRSGETALGGGAPARRSAKQNRRSAASMPVQWTGAGPDTSPRQLQGAPAESASGSQPPRHPNGPPHGDGDQAARDLLLDRAAPDADHPALEWPFSRSIPRQILTGGLPPPPPYQSFEGVTGMAMHKPLKAEAPVPAPMHPIMAEPPAMDASQTRIRHEFGLLGLQLYDRAQEGHIEAAYRLGVLLCANKSMSEGMFYLDKAKEHRHPGAAAMGRVLDRARLHQRALETVYGFGCEAHTDNEILTAVSYCAIAASNDHASAAHMLATLLLGLEQREMADLYHRHATRLSNLTLGEFLTSTNPNTGTRHEIRAEYTRLLADIAPEPRFDRASATQPIDMTALFAAMDAEELAEEVQRIPQTTTAAS
ncbi:hypothetical protein ACLQ2P_41440 [Actinomadura citrea]|uniref:hypothetical protein n=1 Tax=Actinomadura citrea TaxID=46158 RepID=UPI003CE4E138